MSTWSCPNCLLLCGKAENLAEHLVFSHSSERSPSPSRRTKRRRPTEDADEDVDAQPGAADFVCPFPFCEHKQQYRSKFNLLRHFFIHYTCSEDEYLRCPCCLKTKENLGALCAHWEKSCKRKFGTTNIVDEEERRHLNRFGKNRWITQDERSRLQHFENMKTEMSTRLTAALNEATFLPRKQARRSYSQAGSRATFPSFDEETAMLMAAPSPVPSIEEIIAIPGAGLLPSEVDNPGAMFFSDTASVASHGSSTSYEDDLLARSFSLGSRSPSPSGESVVSSPQLLTNMPWTLDVNWPVDLDFTGNNNPYRPDFNTGWWMNNEASHFGNNPLVVGW